MTPMFSRYCDSGTGLSVVVVVVAAAVELFDKIDW
jgi:hypothetical protein